MTDFSAKKNRNGAKSIGFIRLPQNGFIVLWEKEGARKRANVFLKRKTEQSELCSDVVVEIGGFEPPTSYMRSKRSPN